MPTDTADLLKLVQWLSPAFPVGGFAYSHGLEWAVASGDLPSGSAAAAAVADWITDVVRFGAGRAEAILLCHAMRPDSDLGALDDLARALSPSAERLTESRDQGAAFAATVSALTCQTLAPMAMPVAVGAAARTLSLPPAMVAALYLQAFAANITAAAVRFAPLGQTDGQRITQALHPLILAIAQDATSAGLDDIFSAAMGGDMASMQHETLETRIFRT